MAKKRAKKATRRASKAKRSTARRGQRLPKSLTAKQILAAVDVRELEVRSQLGNRQFAVQRRPEDFEPPADVQSFLDELYREPNLLLPDGSSPREDTVRVWRILQSLRDAYRQGCRQGYVEGRLVESLAKDQRVIGRMKKERAKLVPFDGVKIPMDERDARIFLELPAMRHEHGSEKGDELMGRRAGFDDGRQVRNIHFEQTVLREHAALVQQGLAAAEAAERVVQKHGADKHGKPRHQKVRDILAKASQRTLPEVP